MMRSAKIEASVFLEQLRNEVSVYQNFSGIFDKCVQEDYISSALAMFGETFQSELGFVVSSDLTRALDAREDP